MKVCTKGVRFDRIYHGKESVGRKDPPLRSYRFINDSALLDILQKVSGKEC